MAEMIHCPKCAKAYPLKPEYFGKKVKCKQCGQAFVVPKPVVAETIETLDEPIDGPLSGLLDQELAAGAAISVPVPGPAGSPLDAGGPLAGRLKPKKRKRTRPRSERTGPGVSGFAATHKLLVALVLVTFLVTGLVTSAGSAWFALVPLLIGLGITPFGLLPIPARGESPSGKIFACVASAGVLLNLLYGAYTRDVRGPGFSQLPEEVQQGFWIGFVVAALIMLFVAGAVIALWSFLFQRFGFFRVAAWTYFGYWTVMTLLIMSLSAGMRGKSPASGGSGPDMAGPGGDIHDTDLGNPASGAGSRRPPIASDRPTGPPGGSMSNAELDALTVELLRILAGVERAMSKIKDRASAENAVREFQRLNVQLFELSPKLDRAQRDITQPQRRWLRDRHRKEATVLYGLERELKRLRRTPGAEVALAALGRLEQYYRHLDLREIGFGTHDQAIQDIVRQHGNNRVVTVRIEQLPAHAARFVGVKLRELREESGRESRFHGFTSDGVVQITMAPIADLRAFSEKIEFGRVGNIDAQQRVVTVRAIASRLPPPLGPVVKSPSDPDFYKQNLTDLTCWDSVRQLGAASRLKMFHPKELRQEIATTLADLVKSEDRSLRSEAAKALGVWAREEDIAILLGLISADSIGMSNAAMAGLAKAKNPRVIEPMIGMLGKPQSKARDYLIEMGSMTEPAVLKCLDDPDPSVRVDASKVLGAIGSEECIPKLIELANGTDYRVAGAAEKAVKALAASLSDPVAKALLELRLSSRTRTDAARKLARMQPAKDRRQEVARVLAEVLLKGSTFDKMAVVDALDVWHTPDVVPQLAEFAKGRSIFSGQATKILRRIGTPAAVEALADLLTSESRKSAADELIALGPIAEDAVLPLLDHSDPMVCREACDVLEEIGTSKSLPKLTRLVRSQNFFVRNAAQDAGEAIQAAGRTPVKLGSGDAVPVAGNRSHPGEQ